MEFDITFVSPVKVLLDLLKLSDIVSLDPVFPKRKVICFSFQTIKIIESEENFLKGLSPLYMFRLIL